MKAPQVEIAADPGALGAAAAQRFSEEAREAVAARGRFLVALSGGSTPALLYERLAAPPFSGAIAWDRIEIFWSDERGVPPEHSESNYRTARRLLLDRVGVAGQRVHRMPAEESDLDAAARAYEEEIRRALGADDPCFDLVLLGMGADGHTASLFPGSAALAERVRWVMPVEAPAPGVRRLTFTLPLINRARNIVFLVAGAEKARRLSEVLEGPDAGARLPAQQVRPESGRLVWLADRAAASALTTAAGKPRAV